MRYARGGKFGLMNCKRICKIRVEYNKLPDNLQAIDKENR
jgi:hypothetical protein